MNDPSTGLYKSNFDALIFGPDRLISAYNSYDLDYGTEEYGDTITAVNNRFVVSEFNIGSSYSVDDFSNALEVSDLTPNPGDVVDVTAKATNDGFSTGRDVSLKLFGSGAIGEIGSFIEEPVTAEDGTVTVTGYLFRRAEGNMCMDGDSGVIKIDYYPGVRASMETQYRVDQWLADIRYEDAMYAYKGARK